MATSEIEQKATLSRRQVARWLADLARMLDEGGTAYVALTGEPVALELPDEFRCELELEFDGAEVELELELKWRSGPSGG